MKIRLLQDIPIKKEHGMTKGRILEALHAHKSTRGISFWVVGDMGEPIGIHHDEAEISADA